MKSFLKTGFLIALFLLAAKSSYAIKYDLVAPTNTLTRGQQVQFTVNIDTENTSVTSTQVGLSYDTQYLQYVSATPGDAMGAVSVSQADTGKLVLTGTNSTGYTGSGTFAVVSFNLIADSAGSTELCALYAPSTTPTPAPTVAGTTPLPTALPQTGNMMGLNIFTIVGTFFLLSSGFLFAFANHSTTTYSTGKSNARRMKRDS